MGQGKAGKARKGRGQYRARVVGGKVAEELYKRGRGQVSTFNKACGSQAGRWGFWTWV